MSGIAKYLYSELCQINFEITSTFRGFVDLFIYLLELIITCVFILVIAIRSWISDINVDLKGKNRINVMVSSY